MDAKRASGAPVAPYLAAAFGVTWACWGARAALAALGVCGVASVPAQALFFMGGFGPTLAALATRPHLRAPDELSAFLLGGTMRSAGWFALLALDAVAVFGITSAGLNPATPTSAPRFRCSPVRRSCCRSGSRGCDGAAARCCGAARCTGS